MNQPGASHHGLTPMQQGMVVESALSDRPWTNLQQIVVRIGHDLDAAALADAFALAQQRHPIMRSAFRWAGLSEPVIDTHASAPIPWEHHDWARLAATDAQARLHELLDEDRTRGLDLTVAPAQRLTLVRMPEGHVLVWTFHHAMLDGRGFTLVLEDVFDAYDAAVVGQPFDRPAPVATFADHIAALAETPVDDGLRWFGSLLHGVREPTDIPIRNASVPEPARHVDAELVLDRPAVADLENLAEAVGVTTASTVLTAWALLLARYAGTSDVVFGATRSGRHTIDGAEQVAGCFINTLPVRVTAPSDRPLRSVLTDVRSQQVDVRPYEQLSLVDIQRTTEVAAGTPLLSTNVVFERYRMNDQLRARGGRWSEREFEVLEEGSFPLSLSVYHDHTLRLVVEYDPAAFEAHLVDAMLGHLACLLTSMGTADPDQPVGELPIVSSAEAESLVALGRPAHPVDAAHANWVETFVASVGSHADRIAIECGDDTITYAALDRWANTLANRFAALGVGHLDRVVLCLPRSIEFVAALIATHKLGASFVAVDPSYPQAALEHMVTDSAGALIVTRSHLTASLPASDTAVLELDRFDLAGGDATAPTPPAWDASDPAYMIYTSGSSGKPKGVVVSHRALLSHNAAFVADTGLHPDDIGLQFASLSFDVALEELTPALAIGSRVVLRSPAMTESMAGFLDEVETRGITFISLPAAFWHELVHYMEGRDAPLPASVRLLLTGSEKVSAVAFETWRRRCPDVRWLNGYGPTECTITSVIHDPDACADTGLTVEVPIGRPTANAVAYVVDPVGDLAPVGVPGELWLGGPCVANGYFGRPELSAERFITDPFRPGDHRVYRTGDRVRWLPNGELEFMGRTDRQIKLRGFRIEPGEIEAATEQQPEVAQARSAVFSKGSGEALATWVVPVEEATIDEDELRAALQSALPAHMVPEAIVVIDQMPHTAGGKVDDRALPQPTRTLTDTPEVDHRDELDATIAKLFAEALEVPHVNGQASFFDLGGHSLLAVRLLDSIELHTGTKVTLPTLHDNPTPHRLADVIRDGVTEKDQFRYLYPIQPEGDLPPLFGIHVLGTNGAFYRPLAAALGPDQPILGLGVADISGPLDAPVDVPTISAAYADEIQRAAPTGPVSLAAVSLGSVVAMEVANKLRSAGREVALVALFDASGPDGFVGLPLAKAIGHHLRLTRERGVDYATELIRRRVGAIKERFELRRIQDAHEAGGDLDDEQRFLQFARANIAAQEAYTPAVYGGPVALFLAGDERFFDPDWRADGMGWRPYLSGDFHITEVPGSHLAILEEPNVTTLAEKMRELLPAGEATDTK